MSARYRSDWQWALSVCTARLELAETLGAQAIVAGTLGSIGNIHHALGDYPKALSYQERALAMEKELGNRAGVAGTLGNIGGIHRALGDR